MADMQREIVRHSVEDVIHILENEPVKNDMMTEITVVQAMNRLSIAHLSIERAFKFLIRNGGGPWVNEHDLRDRYLEMAQYDAASARFLETAFETAVRHYRFNPNARYLKHLKSLETYLQITGSDPAFNDIRYWEKTQSLNEILLRQVSLSLHIELLHGLSAVLLGSDRPTMTVADRVERAVENAMLPPGSLSYGPGTPKEHSVHSYVDWRRGFSSWRKALANAVQGRFQIGDDFIEDVARNAYGHLLNSSDPAVRYFASTLDVLPTQPRDLIPPVEWLGSERERFGSVKTPAGTHLGFIERGLDRLWYITPS